VEEAIMLFHFLCQRPKLMPENMVKHLHMEKRDSLREMFVNQMEMIAFISESGGP
jgi:hypothetical protein